MPYTVEGLGKISTNKVVLASINGGNQPSSGVNDQNKLIIQSGDHTDISLNNTEVSFGTAANDATTNFICKNSDDIQVFKIPAGPTNANASLAFGISAGQTAQSTGTIAIGSLAGNNTQSIQATAIGTNSGNDTQGTTSVAIGTNAGQTTQGVQSVAIGSNAGQTTQGNLAVAIGFDAGVTSQSSQGIAIGHSAGKVTQGSNSFAMGESTGRTNQGANCTAVGQESAVNNQGEFAVAIGTQAGKEEQGDGSIAIGYQSGLGNFGVSGDAGDHSTLVGSQTKHLGQFGVSLGYKAGFSGGVVDNAFYIGMDGYVDPSNLGNSCIRPEGTLAENGTNSWKLLALNKVTGEIKFLTGLSPQAIGGSVQGVTININNGVIGIA